MNDTRKEWTERVCEAMNRIGCDNAPAVIEVVAKELANQKEELREKVEGMRSCHQAVSEYYSGFNAALDTVLNELK